MRNIIISPEQQIVNKVNSKEEFTYNLTDNYNRYIVSIKNLYTGKNPSLQFDLMTKIQDSINSNNFDSLGTWKDKDNLFYLDANIHLTNFKIAVMTAKEYKQLAIYDNLKKIVINIKS